MKALWTVVVLILLAATASPAAAQDQVNPAELVSSRSRTTFQIAKTYKCRKCTRVRTCDRVPERVCNLQRYCQPRHYCSLNRVGNQIIRKCRSVCQWLTRKLCRVVTKLRCRFRVRCVTAVCAVRG